MKFIAALGGALFLFVNQADSEILGVETFDYPDGPIQGREGGFFWDYDNIDGSHTGTSSDWDNGSGSPVISGGRLVTRNSSAQREYNGPGEGLPNTSDEGIGAVRDGVSHTAVYYRVTVTTGDVLPTIFELRSLDFGAERVGFGKVNNSVNIFGVSESPGISAFGSVPTAPNTTYTLVARLDFDADLISVYVNPDLNGPEGSATPAISIPYTRTNWSTAVRLASGSGGDPVYWDNLVVATSWEDLGTVVTTLIDEDDGLPGGGDGVSLREAVNYSPSGSLITFDPALNGQTLVLSNGELAIDRDLIIDSSGLPFGITIDGNDQSRLFALEFSNHLILKNLTLTGGNGVGVQQGGGGAIFNNLGTLSVTGCTFVGNSAENGGAIFSSTDSDFFSSLTTLLRCTFTGNSTSNQGSAIRNFNGRTELTQCTITENTAPVAGGAVTTYGDSATTTSVLQCIVSANTGSDVKVIPEPEGTSFVSLGQNLIGEGDDLIGFTSILDQTGVTDPGLSPLSFFGGPTKTMLPLPGSPAIDAGSTTDPGETDQRGFPRFVDGDGNDTPALDIGAVEAGVPGGTGIFLEVTTHLDEENIIPDPSVGAGTSLREAIAFAPDGAVIRFANGLQPFSFDLTMGELVLSKNVVIDASSIDGQITISGNLSSRVFRVPNGISAAFFNLAIVDGRSPNGNFEDDGTGGPGLDGGGIFNEGQLSLFDCLVSGNSSGFGGRGTSSASGFVGGSGGNGGGIFSSGALAMNSCEVKGNFAGSGGEGSEDVALDGRGGRGGHGGGIFSSGSLDLLSCVFLLNAAGEGGTGKDAGNGGSGGGIYNSSLLTLLDSSVLNNESGRGPRATRDDGDGGHGGGIYNRGTLLTIRTLLKGNRTASSPSGGSVAGHAGQGGGIFNASGATLDLSQSSLIENETGNGGDAIFTPGFGGSGGGVRNEGACTITACTFQGNQTGEGGTSSSLEDGPGGFGGGISSEGTSLILRHVTLTENDAAGDGGGINSFTATHLENSIVASNTSSTLGPDIRSVSGLITVLGRNFIGDNSDSGIAATPGFIGTSGSPLDPKLTPIDNLGGNTPVALPLPGSPVIDASSGSSATIDQRGIARVGIPDIGAAENRGSPDLGLLWNSDWDGDGNRFGIEHVLKTDPQVSDAGSSRNLSVSEFSGGGQPTISFGYNPDMIPGANWELVRTSDFVTFLTIGTYDGVDLALIDSVDFDFTGQFFKITDGDPPPGRAFYFLKVDFE